MSRNRRLIEVESDKVELKLPASERTAILASQMTEQSLLDRLAATPANKPVAFEIEELEDLHRSLAFDAAKSKDKQRQKLLNKVVGKIETLLVQTDGAPEHGPMPFSFRFSEKLGEALTPVGPPSHVPDSLPPHSQVRLTKEQREILRAMDTVSGDIHKLLDVGSSREEEFEFNPRQTIVAMLAVHEAIEHSPDPARLARFIAISERIGGAAAKLFPAFMGEGFLESDEAPPSPLSNVSYQLKISLEGSRPPIWRRVIAPDCPLDLLHEVIQRAMGWNNAHLHMFEWGEHRFSDPEYELDEDDYDETRINLSELIADGCKQLRYWYDFGDDWWHTIKVEKTLELKQGEQMPRCVKAVGACPPEDCGGLWGYYDLLEALRDKNHERHEELAEWLGEDYDPTQLDLAEINEHLAMLAKDA